jgi:adenylylsulfate kinase
LRETAFTLWCTGLSAAGKSTLCEALTAEIRRRGVPVAWLDGDEVRRELSAGLGFDRADRVENARRVAYVARQLNRFGVHVLVSLISPYREMRDAARAVIDDFVETYVRCPLETCAARDPKALYRRARAGEIPAFTGVSDPYEEPLRPELVVDTERLTPDAAVRHVLAFLERSGRLPGDGVRRLEIELPRAAFEQIESAADLSGLDGPESFLRVVATEAAASLAPAPAVAAATAAAAGADDDVVLARLRDLGYID